MGDLIYDLVSNLIKDPASTFLLGLWSALLGVTFTHFLSKERARRQEFNDAATQFRNAFLDTIVFLENDADIGMGRIVTGNVTEFLQTRKMSYLAALATFKHFLCRWNKHRIQKAWDEYCHPEGIRPHGPHGVGPRYLIDIADKMAKKRP